MNHDETIVNEIKIYTKLLRIKAKNQGVENSALEDEIRESEVILHTLGVNTDDLKPSP